MKSESEDIGNYILRRSPMNNMPSEISSSGQSDYQFRLLEDRIGGLAQQVMNLTQENNALQQQIRRQYFGFTSPNDWTNYSNQGVKTAVDFSHLNLQKPPHVQCSLMGGGNHWVTTGGSSIYHLTNRGFAIYVRYAAGDVVVTAAEAQKLEWRLSYTVTSMD